MSTGRPFVHFELEVKQKFLEVARECSQDKDVARRLAGALLYANLAEYLAEHLLNGLKDITREATREYFNAVVVCVADQKSAPLDKVINQLKQFEFPSKPTIIKLLVSIKDCRNKMSHEIVKTPAANLNKIDEAMSKLCEDTERLVNEMDAIYRGLPPKNLKQMFIEKSPISQEKTNGQA